MRVQAVVRDELAKRMDEFHAIGACGIVMDVRTGEVIAMVSLPDYDANKFGEATPEERFNRAVTGMYEPGSTFKLQTAAMALDSGVGHLWNSFDAAHDIHIGRFTITDFQGKHRFLYLARGARLLLQPRRRAHGAGGGRRAAARLAAGDGHVHPRRHRAAGSRASRSCSRAANWKEVATMTVGFGHGIAVSPLHVVRGTAAIANGGIVLRPTILAPEPGTAPRDGHAGDAAVHVATRCAS